jgi:hypothetical protein
MPENPIIDVFHGQLSPNLAQVYARVVDLPGGQDWKLTGHLRGPECRHARTLPTTHPFVNLGPGENLLSRVTLPDPCFWSPDLPALYRVSLELRRGGIVVQSIDREFGLRFLVTRRNSFYLEGKRWVVRGVHRDAVEESPFDAWRELGAAMVVDDPSDELCREASREGVLLIARVNSDDVATLCRLSQWACIAFVVEKNQRSIPSFQRHLPNTILLGTDATTCSSAVILDVEMAGLEQVGNVSRVTPTIGLRRLGEVMSLVDARSACDLLQRDLAPFGECAGYVV